MEHRLDKPVALTCPECGGALATKSINGATEFRCHIGHAYSAEAMVTGQLLAMERFLQSALRSLNERADLCRQMAEHSTTMEAGNRDIWIRAMKEAFDRTGALEDFLAQTWMHPAAGSPTT